MNGVRFTVLLKGFSTPFVFEVDSERADSVKLELGKKQDWAIIKYPDGSGNAINASRIVAFYWQPVTDEQGAFTSDNSLDSP
jgi:hypothetical protein